MAAWPGWLSGIFLYIGVPETGDNRNFLLQWATATPTPCLHNPLAASHKVKGATNCKRLTSSRTAQSYPTINDGGEATAKQLRSGNFPDLLAALETGHPLQYRALGAVVDDLTNWGATAFAKQIVGAAQKGGFATGGIDTRNVSGSWSRLMHILAHKGPESHKRVAHATARARRIAR